jgi:hypothetical protein
MAPSGHDMACVAHLICSRAEYLAYTILVFLGYHTNPEDPWHVYPVLKVGDFGVSDFTHHLDPTNPGGFVENGTLWYLPPVSEPSPFPFWFWDIRLDLPDLSIA